MCSVCGLPATHTGATTVALLYALPVAIAYLNAWYLATVAFSKNKVRIPIRNILVSIFKNWRTILAVSFTVIVIWRSEYWYYYGPDWLYYFIDTIGARSLSGVVLFASALISLCDYLFGTRSHWLKHVVILLLISGMFMFASSSLY